MRYAKSVREGFEPSRRFLVWLV